MDSLSESNQFVILELRNSYLIESEINQKEISISTAEISTWNLHSVLSSEIVRIQSERNRLIQESSYFRGLLTGNFRPCFIIEWNVETFIDVLKHIYGCSLDITVDNFILLLEAAIFFGVDALLLECKTWLTKATTTKWLPSTQMDLRFVIKSWNFGFDHAIDFIPEVCAGYLARNFMWIISSSSFVNIPYKLLYHCVEHPHLTVDSEKCLAQAILVWIESNKVQWQCSDSNAEYDCLEILQRYSRTNWFYHIQWKRRNSYFSKLAEESIRAILSMIKDPSTRQAFKDARLCNIRLRLTKYTERIVLSGCPQITLASLLLSVLPSLWNMDPLIRKKYEDSITDLDNLQRYPSRISNFPILPFEAVQEVDISKCPGLRVEAVIQCFSKSFPSLRRLNASHCFQFGVSTLFDLVEKCPLVEEVDLTADISPALPTLESTTSSATEMYHDSYVASYFQERRITIVCGVSLAQIVRRNPDLKVLKARGCRNLCDQEGGDQLHIELKRNCSLEEVVLGWGFPFNSMETLGAAIKSLKAITIGLGASLGEYGLKLLPKLCPLLESIVLNFQVFEAGDQRIIDPLENLTS
ncbi:hypothetical protein MKW92_052018 [Papaver armeniacum]|nr:hypothetical protein MKW92_052018 [Papaver armeniacum]